VIVNLDKDEMKNCNNFMKKIKGVGESNVITVELVVLKWGFYLLIEYANHELEIKHFPNPIWL